jgi:hypothetical protein
MLINELMPDPAMLKPNTFSSINYTSAATELAKIEKWIFKNCSEFLKDAKESDNYLYRGIKGVSGGSTIFMGYPPAKRKSIEQRLANDEIAKAVKYADYCMSSSGFTALRSNSIFCTSSISDAGSWGRVFLILPINGFTFGYSKRWTWTTAREYICPLVELKTHVHRLIIDQILESAFYKKQFNTIASSDIKVKKFLKDAYTIGTIIQNYHTIYQIRGKINKILKEFYILVQKYPIFEEFREEADKISEKINLEPTNPDIVEEYMRVNEFYDTDLAWALSKGQDVWVHGAYIAIDNDCYEAARRRFDFLSLVK